MRPVLVLLGLLLLGSHAEAQSVALRRLADGAADIRAAVGDTLTIEVAIDLGGLHAAGLALHVSLPPQVRVVERDAARPFRPGLFGEGVEFANEAVPVEQTYGLPAGASLLTYAVVLGPGVDRFRSGAGAVATFDVVCAAPVDGAIRIVDSAAHRSMVILDDGRTELALKAASPVGLAVSETVAKRVPATWGDVKNAAR